MQYIKKRIVEHVDLIVVRELIGGIYFWETKRTHNKYKNPKSFQYDDL